MRPGAVPLTMGLSYDVISPILSSCYTLGGTTNLFGHDQGMQKCEGISYMLPAIMLFRDDKIRFCSPVSSIDVKHVLKHRQRPLYIT